MTENVTITLSRCDKEVDSVTLIGCDCSSGITWDSGNPETIVRGQTITLSIIAGSICGPYTWSVSGSGFTVGSEVGGTSNTVTANGSACGSATITVTGCDGTSVTGYLRCTTGAWTYVSKDGGDLGQCSSIIADGGGSKYGHKLCRQTGYYYSNDPCGSCSIPYSLSESEWLAFLFDIDGYNYVCCGYPGGGCNYARACNTLGTYHAAATGYWKYEWTC